MLFKPLVGILVRTHHFRPLEVKVCSVCLIYKALCVCDDEQENKATAEQRAGQPWNEIKVELNKIKVDCAA